MRKNFWLWFVLLSLFMISCKTVNLDCNEEHFRSKPLITQTGFMVAVMNLRSTLENTDEFCDPDFAKQVIYLNFDNAMDETISFDYELTMVDSLGVTVKDQGAVKRLAPGESTDEKIISRDLLDMIGADIIFSGTNLEAE